MSNQGCGGRPAWGQEGAVQWEVTRLTNSEPRAAERPEAELLTNAPVSLRVLTGVPLRNRGAGGMVMRVASLLQPFLGFHASGLSQKGLW